MAWGLVSMTLRGLVLVVSLLWTVTSSDGGDVHVTCVFSEDCVLPCSFQPGSEEVIHWLLNLEDKDLTIHSYYNSTDQLKQQSQHYRGRTALFNDQIPKGNASLLLRGIRLQDQGRYKCYTSTIQGNKESFINIAVEAPVRLVDIQLSDDIITCSYTGIYPEPKLTWSTDPPSDLSFDPGTIQNSTSIKVDDRGLYDITSTKQFSRDRTNICTVTSGTIERTATLKQQAPVQGPPSSEVSIPCSVSQSDLLTFNLTWRFNQIDTILTYTKGTPQMYVVDKWKEQVQNLSDSGSLQLHKLTMIHQGTYSCELSTARDTHLILTYLQITPDKPYDVSDGLSPGSITGIIIAAAAAAVIIAAVICYLLRDVLPQCRSNTVL
ncbi:CD276 antigen-like [Salvelinus alpinus]